MGQGRLGRKAERRQSAVNGQNIRVCFRGTDFNPYTLMISSDQPIVGLSFASLPCGDWKVTSGFGSTTKFTKMPGTGPVQEGAKPLLSQKGHVTAFSRDLDCLLSTCTFGHDYVGDDGAEPGRMSWDMVGWVNRGWCVLSMKNGFLNLLFSRSSVRRWGYIKGSGEMGGKRKEEKVKHSVEMIQGK